MGKSTLVALVIAAVLTVVGSQLHFLTLADWGGQPTAPYTTPGERATAKTMASVAAAMNSSFVLALGDNFYDQGNLLTNAVVCWHVVNPRLAGQECLMSTARASKTLLKMFFRNPLCRRVATKK